MNNIISKILTDIEVLKTNQQNLSKDIQDLKNKTNKNMYILISTLVAIILNLIFKGG